MAKLLKLRRGTDTQHTTFTGAEGEVTVNTTNDSLHVHDGTTAGGTELAKADLSNAAGASIPGTLTTNRLVVDDDGSASPNAVFKTDDQSPWAVAIKNDTYSTTETHGLLFHQESAGDVYIRNGGNAAYENTWLQHHDGTNTRNMVRLDADGSVSLYNQNSRKLLTTSTGIDVTGTVTCDGMTSDGTGTFHRSAEYQIVVKDNNNTGSGAETAIAFQDSAATVQGWVGHVDSGNSHLYLRNQQNADLRLGTNGADKVKVTNGGFEPFSTNTFDLGNGSNQWRNGYFDGTVFCDNITSDGTVTIQVPSGAGLVLKDTNSAGNASSNYLEGRDSANTQKWYVGDIGADGDLYLRNNQSGSVYFGTSSGNKFALNNAGHVVPVSNNAYDLGEVANRWRNIYTNDLNLSNEGGTNDVDGTWGSWTIQEGEDDLFLLNRRNGKKYKFNLSEVN